MLEIRDREEILKRYLKNEEKKLRRGERVRRIDEERATEDDFKWLIGEETEEVEKKREFLRLLLKNGNWTEFLYRNGYLCSPFNPKRRIQLYSAERLQVIRQRYQTWKRIRPYLTAKGLTEDTRMYPAYKNCIFHLHAKDPEDLLTSSNLLIQMIMNYIPFYNIYLYDPLPNGNHAYRYYSGEPILVYFITESIAENPHHLRRVKKAIFQQKANGYSLKNVYKLVICTFDWKPLDDQRGTGEFKVFTLNPDAGDLRQQCMAYWKDYTGSEPFFKALNTMDYVKKHRVLPWPYTIKDGNFHLLETVNYWED